MIVENPSTPVVPERRFLLADHNAHMFVPGSDIGQRLERVARVVAQQDISLGPVIRDAADAVKDWIPKCELGDVIQIPMLQLTIVRVGSKLKSLQAIVPNASKTEPRILTT